MVGADDVDGGFVFAFGGAVGDGKRLVAHAVGLLVVGGGVPEEAEKGKHPCVAGERGGGVGVGETLEFLPEGPPESLGVGKGAGDDVVEIALAREPKIGGLLAGELFVEKLLQKIGSEQTTFDTNSRESLHRFTTG